jgi:purine-binding chemotaxis protein CheW
VAATGKVFDGHTTRDFAGSYSTVISTTSDHLRPVPEFSSTIGTDHVLAIRSLENRMLIVLDIERLMRSPEMGLIAETVQ